MTQQRRAVGGTDAQIRRALRQNLHCAEIAGLQFLARPRGSAAPDTKAPDETRQTTIAERVRPGAASPPDVSTSRRLSQDDNENSTSPRPTGTREDTLRWLNVIQQEVSRCTCCEQLAAQRTQTVFGVGNPQARLCLLGEAPGADEDRLGEPFVGRAGQLLDKILAACTLTREEVYILNVLKCRPPQNRTPSVEEVENCRGFFERQLELIQPEFICCLGSVAASSLLRTKSTLGRLRGKFHDWRGIQVMVTYHPAYLLRNPSAKVDTWKDMQMLMQAMDIKLR